MAKDRRIPKWLARRSYFKRIERWSKSDKTRGAPTAAESAPTLLPSNVVPFPMRRSPAERPDFMDLRDVGIA